MRDVSWKGYDKLKSRSGVKEEEREKNINGTKADGKF